MQKSWGIYRGFNPYTDPIHKWKEPLCQSCHNVLKPWIDWNSYGCIAYCETCNDFYVVKSNWVPVSGIHPRAEISELTGHDVKKNWILYSAKR